MSEQQIKAYNEMGQMLMDKLGCTSQEAKKMIQGIMDDILESLNNGVLD